MSTAAVIALRASRTSSARREARRSLRFSYMARRSLSAAARALSGVDRIAWMFDRFTEDARKSMSLARQEAFRFRHDYIGTEHMLVGIVEEGSGVGSQILGDLGAEPGAILAAVRQIMKSGSYNQRRPPPLPPLRKPP